MEQFNFKKLLLEELGRAKTLDKMYVIWARTAAGSELERKVEIKIDLFLFKKIEELSRAPDYIKSLRDFYELIKNDKNFFCRRIEILLKNKEIIEIMERQLQDGTNNHFNKEEYSCFEDRLEDVIKKIFKDMKYNEEVTFNNGEKIK